MFHAKDGWFFARGYNNGDVLIEHRVYGEEKNSLGEAMYTIDAKVNMTADAWASIVSNVSAMGETRETWFAARAFHNGEPVIVSYPLKVEEKA